MSRSATEEPGSGAAEQNPMKKLIPKRTKLRNFEGCSPLKEYDLLEKIGEGTFGEVHKALHRKHKDLVALKRILMHNEKDGFPITALREIKILKMLSHPNVIRLSDMVVERGDKSKKKRGSIYMATPYMDHDLCGLLDNPKVTFSVPQIKCYMRQLLEGTAYLHEMKILHRDMKAANLLISNEGLLQIADFGLARSYYDEPPPGSNERRREYTTMVVTRWYRPPELLLGDRHYTPAIDLWGVGCILAEMYRGKPILQGPNDVAQLDMIFQLCGTPTEITMPGWTLLPGCEGIKSFKSWPRTLEKEYHKYGSAMVDLLSGLMTLDPAKRLKAPEALRHVYFASDPLPAAPKDLPSYEASHELDKSKYRASRGKEARTPRAPDAAGQMAQGNHNSQPMADRTGPPTTGQWLKDPRHGAHSSKLGEHDKEVSRSQPRANETHEGDRDRGNDRGRDQNVVRDKERHRDRDLYPDRDRDSDRHREERYDARDRDRYWDRDDRYDRSRDDRYRRDRSRDTRESGGYRDVRDRDRDSERDRDYRDSRDYRRNDYHRDRSPTRSHGYRDGYERDPRDKAPRERDPRDRDRSRYGSYEPRDTYASSRQSDDGHTRRSGPQDDTDRGRDTKRDERPPTQSRANASSAAKASTRRSMSPSESHTKMDLLASPRRPRPNDSRSRSREPGSSVPSPK